MQIKPLAGLCRRLSIALGAGIDLRTAWTRETDRATGHAARQAFGTVGEAIDRGEGLDVALAATGDCFPTLFREMTEVGQQTGHLSEVFAQLADHYENQLELRRGFLAAISWPVLELGLSLAIIGFLIWIMGFIHQIAGGDSDPLGFGLVGNAGLAVYILVLAAIAAPLLFTLHAMRRGLAWTRPFQLGLLRLPVLGKPLETLALSRLAWSMHVTMNTGMDVRRALRLSLQSTNNARFTDQIPAMEEEIRRGHSIHEAFVRTGVYPDDFLDALAVGEESGKLVESMARLSRQYHQQARVAMAALTKIGGFSIWLGVAAIIVFFIFRLAAFYVNTIQDAVDGRF